MLNSFQSIFTIPFVALWATSSLNSELIPSLSEKDLTDIDSLISSKTIIQGPLREKELTILFPEQDTFPNSCLSYPIYNDSSTCLGILVCGHSNPNHFSSKNDTTFIGFLLEIINFCFTTTNNQQ